MAANIKHDNIVHNKTTVNQLNSFYLYSPYNACKMRSFVSSGSALAQDIAILVMVLGNVLYVLITGFHKETWRGLDRRCLLEWGPFMRLAMYSMLMTCMEWWAFEITVLIAGKDAKMMIIEMMCRRGEERRRMRKEIWPVGV